MHPVNNRTAAAWRLIRKAPPSMTPPLWIYQREKAILACAKYVSSPTNASRLLQCKRCYEALFETTSIRSIPSLSEEGNKRLQASLDSLSEHKDDVNAEGLEITATEEDIRCFYRFCKDETLK